MSGNMARNKGQRGEREVIALLQPVIDKAYGEAGMEAPVLKRNLMQTQDGGFDIVGLNWMALEVKYQEAENLTAWWAQATRQAMVKGTLVKDPVLIWRKNGAKWRVKMLAPVAIGDRVKVRMPVVISVEDFLVWLYYRLKNVLVTVDGGMTEDKI